MIRVVVRQDQDLAQQSLPIAMRNWFIQFFFTGFLQQDLHLLEITTKLLDTLLPRFVTRRLLRFRPVSFRPLGRDVLRTAAELEDVPLPDAQVFEQLPCRVWRSIYLLPAQF